MRPVLTGLAATSALSLFPLVTGANASITGPATRSLPAETVTLTAAARPWAYTIRPGDTLTQIAARLCGTPTGWAGLYHTNQAAIGPDPNIIRAGKDLTVTCTTPPVTTAAITRPRYRDRDGDNDNDGARTVPHATRPRAGTATYHGSSAMQQCIITRESGGNSQIMNSTGHYGLYQFSYATWVAHGGSPSTFGHASVAEQNRVFWNTVAADGYRDWTPYDGCAP